MRSYADKLVKSVPLIIVGMLITIYIALMPNARDGLEFMFLIPLSLVICLIIFSDIIECHKGGIGLKIFYGIIIFRYYISPFLIAFTSSKMKLDILGVISNRDYYFAIIMTILELIVSCAVIKYTFFKTLKKVKTISIDRTLNGDTIHFGGLVVVFFLIAIMLLRGNSNEIFPAMRFFVATEKFENQKFDNYSIIAIQAIKSFLSVGIIAWCAKKNNSKEEKIYLIISMVVALLNCAVYFGNNRSSVMQTGIATIAVLFAAFRKDRKVIAITMIPVVIVIIYSFTMLKQFGVDATETSMLEATSISQLSNTIESYVGGLNPMASAHAMYLKNGTEFSLLTVIKDIVDNIFLFKIPGFNFINEWFNDITGTAVLYAGKSTAMLTLAGQTLYYGGEAFGWIFDVLALGFVVKLLVYFDITARIQVRLSKKFIYTYLAALFGLIMCYCLITLLWSFSNTPFFLIILFYVNEKFVVTWRDKNENTLGM